MKTELNRRTWLTAVMALPILRWAKPKTKWPTGIIAGKPYYVVGLTRGRFGIVTHNFGIVTHKDDGNFVAVTDLNVGQAVYFK